MQKTTKEKKRKTRRKKSANKTLNNEWQGLHLKHDTSASVQQALQQSTERSRREQSPEVSAVSCCLKCLLQHSMTVMGQWVRFTIHVQNFRWTLVYKDISQIDFSTDSDLWERHDYTKTSLRLTLTFMKTSRLSLAFVKITENDSIIYMEISEIHSSMHICRSLRSILDGL